MAERKKKRSDSRRNISRLSQHKHIGKNLVPPLAQLPSLSFQSWVDTRLPDYLWIALIVCTLPRDDALCRLRHIAKNWSNFAGPQSLFDISHTSIAAMDDAVRVHVLDAICESSDVRAALLPLLVCPLLPAFDAWKERLGAANFSGMSMLASAIARTFDHQSQEATDCRWFIVACAFMTGNVHCMEQQREFVEGIRLYPNYGPYQWFKPALGQWKVS